MAKKQELATNIITGEPVIDETPEPAAQASAPVINIDMKPFADTMKQGFSEIAKMLKPETPALKVEPIIQTAVLPIETPIEVPAKKPYRILDELDPSGPFKLW